MKLPLSLFSASLGLFGSLAFVHAVSAEGTSQTHIRSEDLAAESLLTLETGDGAALVPLAAGAKTVLWTQNTQPDFRGVTFGDSSTPGARHLLVQLKVPTAVGTVIVRGGGRLSVLKEGVAGPGRPAAEEEWISAERLSATKPGSEAVAKDELATWVLPPGTKTSVLRFTHDAQASDPKYAGWLGGAIILQERYANVAPQAQVAASSQEEAAGKLINSQDEQWKTWDNGTEGAAQVVTSERSEWVMLIWPQAVKLTGLETLGTGFGTAEVEQYAGDASVHPREAAASQWKSVKTYTGLSSGYPLPFSPRGLMFDQPITTRAVRLRLTSSPQEGHPHMKSRPKDGRRVWLAEVMALTPLGTAGLKSAVQESVKQELFPPIPVKFHLKEPGVVTLVIEDQAGKRVRNLVAETPYPAGENTAWWDGTDDLGRDRDAAEHGLYHIPGQPVAPGAYRVRGLVRKPLDLRYEFSIYNAGNPAWSTADTTGGWLTNHSPPQAALFVGADKSPTGKAMVYLGSAVSEGGAGLAWVGLDGVKLGGRGWIGGNWTAAPHLAADRGTKALPDVYAYVAATWTATSDNRNMKDGELRITGLTAKGDKAILKMPFNPPPYVEDGSHGDHHWLSQLAGIAAHDGVVVASMPKLGKLIFVDAAAGKVIGEVLLPGTRGVAFDSKGRLLVVTEKTVFRYGGDVRLVAQGVAPEALITVGLEDGQGITLDGSGNILVSDHGASHQVKVFSPDGKLVRAIGRAGQPAAGKYDPLHMNQPLGMAVDEKGNIWVTEHDFQPKRVSVWSPEGKLEKTFYGPGRYGGGGTLDPVDKTRFYYDGLEFKLDWEKGTSVPVAVIYRPGGDELSNQFRSGAPEGTVHVEGRQYMTNSYNSNPTGGHGFVTVWLLKNAVAMPVASLGRADLWPLLKEDRFRSRWPQGVDLASEKTKNQVLFAWSDLNEDGRVQEDEVQLQKAAGGGYTLMSDLSITASRVDDKAVQYPVTRFTKAGVPVYELTAGKVLATGVQNPASSGGDQVLVSKDGWSVLTVAPLPYAKEGFGGVKDGVPMWSYPSVWPGLHASHEAALPDQPGQVIGSTRLLGGFIEPAGKEVGPLWGINGNMGDAYLFTADGLFVAQLFQDSRLGKPWTMPRAERGALLNELTLHDENFFPTLAQAADGKVYLCDGSRTSLVRVDGLESLKRLPATELKVTEKELKAAAAWRVQAEVARQQARGSGTMEVPMLSQAPVVDGKIGEWEKAVWTVIDRRGTAANFNSDSKPYDITGSVAIAGDRLYAAYRTQDPELLKNSGETPNAPFKTGGCLDVMIGTDEKADPKRPRPVAGDQRLLVTQVKGKTVALVYRAVVPGTKIPVPFSSPWRTITLDAVHDVSADVELASSVEKDEKGKVKSAFYEISIPLSALGWKPVAGSEVKGDIGILRGNGFQTLQRVYWNNKATGITADVPSEAELTPALWGKWKLVPASPQTKD
ncbi:hypothetical protein [Verrucomicrobium sp. BvORR106]|uniref:hypothetical protein n=1 Tax=Verrucomicrobium sp. BvORR106 TaxID=1403819 RepID=UPI00056DD25C|nr:hypothetical protein [Verrucomicrobium sp. BvORR106]